MTKTQSNLLKLMVGIEVAKNVLLTFLKIKVNMSLKNPLRNPGKIVTWLMLFIINVVVLPGILANASYLTNVSMNFFKNCEGDMNCPC